MVREASGEALGQSGAVSVGGSSGRRFPLPVPQRWQGQLSAVGGFQRGFLCTLKR